MESITTGCPYCKITRGSLVFKCDNCGMIFCTKCGKATLFEPRCPRCREDQEPIYLGTSESWKNEE